MQVSQVRHHADAECFGRKPVDHWKLNTPYFTHFNCVWPDTEVGPHAWESATSRQVVCEFERVILA